ncbi:MAG: gas vesicle protein GvpD P-loop domain-containing protein [Thermoprotei archaeon]
MDPLLSRLANFFGRGGKTLLVGGSPGTGKTTLALQLSQMLKPSLTTIISTRMPEELLFKQYPWIKKELSNIKVFDFRFGSAEILAQKFIESVKVEEGLIVVDSLDSVTRFLSDVEARKFENTIISIASSQANTRTVVTSEITKGFGEGSPPLGFAADGIVELVMRVEHGRVFRKAVLHKLRGSVIDRAEFPFTLTGARIYSFEAYREHGDESNLEKKRHRNSGITAGDTVTRTFEKVFGDIEPGCTCLLEFEADVPINAVMSLIFPRIAEYVVRGGSAYLLPPQQLSPAKLAQIIPRLIPPRDSAQRLRVWVDLPGFSEPYFFGFTPQSPESDINSTDKVRSELRQKSVAHSVLVVRSLDKIEGMFPSRLEEVKGALLRSVATGNAMGDFTLVVSSSTAKLRDTLLSVSTRHYRLEAQSGVVFLHGVKPWTQTHIVGEPPILGVFPPLFPVE